MSNNEQPQRLPNYFSLRQHESEQKHSLHVQLQLLGIFLPYTESDQQVHLALDLIKSQTMKKLISFLSWSIYVKSPVLMLQGAQAVSRGSFSIWGSDA